MLWVLLAASVVGSNGHTFKTLHSWQVVDFDFPNEDVRQEYLSSGKYIPGNNMPLGLQTWQDKMFITVPRWRNGVVSNLNYIAKDDPNMSPILKPFPDWEANNINSSDGFVSIFRVRVDPCDRLWGVDTGIDDILGNFTAVRPVRLFTIDLKTNKVINIYTFKESDQKPESFFADLVVDVEPNACDDAYVYSSDLGGYGIFVYSMKKNDSWRISHNFFHFDPLQGNYNISGFEFQWTDGVFGMSLSPMHADGYKTLYFHAMSGATEFSVSTEVLKDSGLTRSQDYYAFHVEGSKGPMSQGPSSLIDPKTGINYFTQVSKNGISCWDTSTKLNPETFLLAAQDNETMVFPNDLTIDPSSNKLYVLSDNLPQFQYSRYNISKNNFYITVSDLNDLTSLCQAGTSQSKYQ